MNLLETVSAAIAEWPAPSARQDDIVVPTHCLYPSNGVVHVYVSGGDSTFKVTDGGGAFDEDSSRGTLLHEDVSIVRAAAKPMGLDVSQSGIF